MTWIQNRAAASESLFIDSKAQFFPTAADRFTEALLRQDTWANKASAFIDRTIMVK
jgi:hypothetical protein